MNGENSDECRPWFEEAFEARYLDLYAHRNEAAAAREAAFAVEALGLSREGPVLDVSCGPGYHLHALGKLGVEAVGLDLSASLISCAPSPRAMVRGDMRRLPLRGPFQAVLTFYTTLGYFGEAENRSVLREVGRVLRPGGAFLLDHLNEAWVRASLVPRSEREVKGRTIVEARRIEEDPARVIKRVEIWGDGGEATTYTESVRLYKKEELSAALAGAGLTVESVFGDFDGRPLDGDSPRMILVGKKG